MVGEKDGGRSRVEEGRMMGEMDGGRDGQRIMEVGEGGTMVEEGAVGETNGGRGRDSGRRSDDGEGWKGERRTVRDGRREGKLNREVPRGGR